MEQYKIPKLDYRENREKKKENIISETCGTITKDLTDAIRVPKMTRKVRLKST